MRLSRNDYKLLGSLALLLSLCWGTRFLLFLRSAAPFPLTPEWQVDLGRATYDRPGYQEGLVLLPASRFLSSRWYGIEAETGQIAWSQRDGWWYQSYRRCLTSDYLVLSGLSSLMVLEVDTGEVVWSWERAHTATCSNKILFYSDVPRDTIHALDLTTKQYLWSETSPLKSFNGLIYNPEARELIASESTVPEYLYIVDPQTGVLKHFFEEISTPPYENERSSTYLVDQGELFVGGTVLDAQTGQIIHKEEVYTTDILPTVTAETMYLSTGQVVVAFDRADYQVKWIYKPPPQFGVIPVYPLSPVTVPDQVGYVIYSDATLRAIEPETGKELGYWQPGWIERFFWPACVPFPFPLCVGRTGIGTAASEDRLFVSFGNGKLYAFEKGE